MRQLYQYTFTVTGRGVFPMDMLRYDACHPMDGFSAERIETSRELRTVKLISRGRERHWQPTHARWASFLWTVDASSVEGFPHD